MQTKDTRHRASLRGIFLVTAALLLAACSGGGGGGGKDGPAIQARPQSISFASPPTLVLGATASVSATASSGLPITYSSATPFICTVNAGTGLVTALAFGECIIGADQFGNTTYAPVRQTLSLLVQVDPNQTIAFAADAPVTLGVFDLASLKATASSGLPVSYSSLSPAICAINDEGQVTGLAAGACVIEARQGGTVASANQPLYHEAIKTHQILVAAPAVTTAPGKPVGVKATAGSAPNTVKVTIGGVLAGGAAITGFTVNSVPAGITATGTSSTITLSCPASCNGYAFEVIASNAIGDSPASDAAHVITSYKVVETFYEPATQPNDSIFTGSFDFDSTTGSVSNLAGNLTESMTGGCATLAGCPGSYGSVPMTLVPLKYQLSAIPVTLGGVSGLLVTTFALNTLNTFFVLPDSTDSWSPQAGVDVGGVYYGFPAAPNPFSGGVGNAYAMIFVNTTNPLAPLNQAQIDKLAYADCAAGGMMGAVCMTGTSIAGYGMVGTMGGYPVSQVITRKN